MKTTIITIIVIVLLLLGAWYAFNSFNVDSTTTPAPEINTEVFSPQMTTEDPIMCPADVMQCPDGTYVGRMAPSCGFAPCPAPIVNPGNTFQPTPPPATNPPVFTPPNNK